MNAEQYYQRNVVLHDSVVAEPSVRNHRILPSCPSELDYALSWLATEGIRGALLDVGCAGLRLLANAVGFERRCGVDIVPFPAWQAYPSIETQICNLDDGCLPYPDESFEAVTCLMVIEHVFDPFHGVAELRRVCKPAGRVVIGVPNLAGIKRRWELLRGKLPVTSSGASFSENAWDGYHLHNFTQASLDWLLRKEGLVPMRWAAQGSFRWAKQRWPALLGNDLVVLARKGEPEPARAFPF